MKSVLGRVLLASVTIVLSLIGLFVFLIKVLDFTTTASLSLLAPTMLLSIAAGVAGIKESSRGNLLSSKSTTRATSESKSITSGFYSFQFLGLIVAVVPTASGAVGFFKHGRYVMGTVASLIAIICTVLIVPVSRRLFQRIVSDNEV